MSGFTNHKPLTSHLPTALRCPTCGATDLKKLSLIHAEGTYESRGSVFGFLLGSADGLLFARHRGTNQSLLSKSVSPPRKAPYLAPAILWFIGFFVVMACAGSEKLSTPMAFFSVAYVVLLPAYVVAALFFNFLVHPKKYRNWNEQFICLRCGHRASLQSRVLSSL
jgi:hypothetical protein